MEKAFDDSSLIISLRKGERVAFEEVYRKFIRPLRYFVEQRIDNRQAAEDITAETLSKAFQRHTDFKDIDKLRSFLFSVAHNAVVDYHKMYKHHERVHEELRYTGGTDLEDAELIYIRTEATRAIYEAIEALPTQARRVIQMAFIEGKKLGQIAEELNLSYNTVQNYRSRGLELIRVRLIKNKWLSHSVLMVAFSLLERH